MIDRDAFERRYADTWQRLENLLEIAEKGSRDPALSQLPRLYRLTCEHLSLARSRGYGRELERQLDRLVLRGHQVLYGSGRLAGRQWLHLLAIEFPRTLRANARTFWIATALFWAPVLLSYSVVSLQPRFAHSVIDGEALRDFETMYDDESGNETRASEDDVVMFGYYIYNNVSIAFRTFASGIVFGLGSIFFLVYNGAMFGTVAAHVQGAGWGENFYAFVIGHCSFELTAICISGMAGLQLGAAVLAPGNRSRAAALRSTAHDALPLVYGATLFLLVAALIEAFWSSTPTPPGVRFAVGLLLWAAVIVFLWLAGSRRLSSPHREA